MYGDVNNSGKVDVADAILILRHIVGLKMLVQDNLQAADVNADGEVDVGDAILVLRYIVGLVDLLQAQKYLNDAEDAVGLAEDTRDPEDIRAAWDLVNALPNISPKVTLQRRLNDLDAIGAAMVAVGLAENAAEVLKGDGFDAQEDISVAQGLYYTAADLVGNLPASSARVSLEARLAVVQNIISAAQKAYEDRLAANAVMDLISELPGIGDLLLEDRGIVESARNAYDALNSDAQSLVTNLDDLLAAEGAIVALESAADAVERAEFSMIRQDADTALGLVIELPDGYAKTNLSQRLEAVFGEIEKRSANDCAIFAIASLPPPFEISLADKSDVQAARALVDIAKEVHGAVDGDIFNLGKLLAAEARIALLETSYTVTYIAGPNGFIDGLDSQTVPYGTDGLPVTAVPDEGYYFVNWSDGADNATRIDTDINSDLEVTANFALIKSYSEYSMTLDGPDEAEIGQHLELSLGTWAEEPYGNSSYQATYKYNVVGGECSLFRRIALLADFDWFELQPDIDNRDRPIELMFLPCEAGTYKITVVLQTVEGLELAAATHIVRAGTGVAEVADIDAITVDFGTAQDDLELPESVEVVLADNARCDVSINWDFGAPAYNGMIPGTYSFTGILVLPDGVINPGNLTAQVNVTVAEERSYMVTLFTGAENVLAGEAFAVDVNISSAKYDVFYGATIEIIYDNSMLQHKDAANLPDGFYIYSITDGTITTITIIGASGGQGYSISNNVFLLATLNFEVRLGIPPGSTAIVIADDPIVNQEDDVQSTIATKGEDIRINLMNP